MVALARAVMAVTTNVRDILYISLCDNIPGEILPYSLAVLLKFPVEVKREWDWMSPEP